MYEEIIVNVRIGRWLMGFALLFVLAGALPTPAQAQVVVVTHRRHHHRRHHRHVVVVERR
jgi:hypothetical protein